MSKMVINGEGVGGRGCAEDPLGKEVYNPNGYFLVKIKVNKVKPSKPTKGNVFAL